MNLLNDYIFPLSDDEVRRFSDSEVMRILEEVKWTEEDIGILKVLDPDPDVISELESLATILYEFCMARVCRNAADFWEAQNVVG